MTRVTRSACGAVLRSPLGVRGATAALGTLLICGNFTSAGGVAAKNLAVWNGSVWARSGPATHGLGAFTGVARHENKDVIVCPTASEHRVLYATDTDYLPLLGADGVGLRSGGRLWEPDGRLWATSAVSRYPAQPGDDPSYLDGVRAVGGNWSVGAFGPIVGANTLLTRIVHVGGAVHGTGFNNSNRGLLTSGSTSTYGPGLQAGQPQAAVEYQGKVYLGGNGMQRSGDGAGVSHSLYRLDPGGWTPIISDANFVIDLVVWNGLLIIGGFFTNTAFAGFGFSGALAWDGASFINLGGGPGTAVNSMGILNGQLVAGGTLSGGVRLWNGSSWSAVGGGVAGGTGVVNQLKVVS